MKDFGQKTPFVPGYSCRNFAVGCCRSTRNWPKFESKWIRSKTWSHIITRGSVFLHYYKEPRADDILKKNRTFVQGCRR